MFNLLGSEKEVVNSLWGVIVVESIKKSTFPVEIYSKFPDISPSLNILSLKSTFKNSLLNGLGISNPIFLIEVSFSFKTWHFSSPDVPLSTTIYDAK